MTPRPISCKHLEIWAPPAGKIIDFAKEASSSWPRLKSAGARYDVARLVRESNKMLSDLAPLEMSAPEPADARLSGVGSAQTPLRLAQLLLVRRTTRALDETRQVAETSCPPDGAFLPHSPIFFTLASLFGEARLLSPSCCRGRSGNPQPECPESDATKPARNDDADKSRSRCTPKCSITALVNHVKGRRGAAETPSAGGNSVTAQSVRLHLITIPTNTFFFFFPPP